MPDNTATRRIDRPAEGFATARLPGFADRPVRTYIPADYQPLYPYPLVVLFPGDDANEDLAARLAPRLSRRNFITIGLRAALPADRRDDGHTTYAWDRRGSTAMADCEYAAAAIAAARRDFNVHPERLFLLGVCEGVAAAGRVAAGLSERIAGLVAMNGCVPPSAAESLRGVPVLMGHGTANPFVPFACAKRNQRALAEAGAEVRLVSYPTTQRLHANMLRDANRWIVGRVLAAKTAAQPG